MVGAIAAVPLRCIGRDGGFLAAALTTARVGVDWRFGSLNLINQLIEAHQDTWIFDSTPTTGMTRLLEQYNFEKLHRGLPTKKFPANKLSLLLRLSGRCRPARMIDAYYVNSKPSTNEAFELLVDEMWDKANTSLGPTMVRDSRFFRWLCRNNPCRLLTGFLSTSQSGRPEAVAVCLDNQHGGLVVVDHWVAPGQSQNLVALRRSICAAAATHGFHSVRWHEFNTDSFRHGSNYHQEECRSLVRRPAGQAGGYWTLIAGDLGI